MAVLTETLPPICIGVDVGQIRDPTAIAVAEVLQKPTGKYRARDHSSPVMRSEYQIRSISRLPLRTSYPDVAVHLAQMLCSPLLANRSVRVLIDVTGVGRPVYQDLEKEIALREEASHVQLKPITFSSGANYHPQTGILGKAYLVSRLQSLLQSYRIHAPDTHEVRAMLEELRTYEIRVDIDGHDTYGAFKTGTHDDLATALGLAVLEDPYDDDIPLILSSSSVPVTQTFVTVEDKELNERLQVRQQSISNMLGKLHSW